MVFVGLRRSAAGAEEENAFANARSGRRDEGRRTDGRRANRNVIVRRCGGGKGAGQKGVDDELKGVDPRTLLRPAFRLLRPLEASRGPLRLISFPTLMSDWCIPHE